MTSIFGGQPPQNKAFSNQQKGHLSYRYILLLYLEPLKSLKNSLATGPDKAC